MAKTKSAGSTKLGRDARPKYLGLKVTAGQIVRPGMVLIRQRGTKFRAGKDIQRGADDTLYAVRAGVIRFKTKRIKHFDGTRKESKIIYIE